MNRRHLILTAAVSLLLSFYSSNLPAQAPNDYLDRIGVPDFSVNEPVEMGAINLASGNLHLEFPMGSLAQRGKEPFTLKLVYDSQIYGTPIGTVWSPHAMLGNLGGWRIIDSSKWSDIGTPCNALTTYCGNLAGVDYGVSDGTCDLPNQLTGTYSSFSNFSYQDPDGTSKSFALQTYNAPTMTTINCPVDKPNDSGYALDGSGYFMAVTNYSQAVVLDNHGKRVYPSVEDTNGNVYGRNTSGPIDFDGRNPVLRTLQGNLVFYDVLNSQGGRSRYTITTETINVHTAFGPSGMVEYSGLLTVVQSLTLPNGTSYSFSYDSGSTAGHYGSLTGVTLPTGAQVQYGYTNFMDSQCSIARWVSSRNSQGNIWNYQPLLLTERYGACPVPIPPSGIVDGFHQVTVGQPDGSSIIYTFTVRDQYGAWMTSAVFNDSGGNTLQTITKDYVYPGVGLFAGALHPARITTAVPFNGGELSRKTEYSWTMPNLTEIREWDFYSGTAPSAPARVTDVTYTAATPAYVNANILSKPTGLTIKDGSGNLAAQRIFEYDNYTAGLSASGAIQHDSAYGASYTPRGNMTAIQRWRNSDGAWLTTRNQYDDAGNEISTTDPGGHSVTFSFVDSWADATCAPIGGTAAAFRTTVTNAKGQSETSKFNSCSGTLASATDVNNFTTNFTYNDPLGRLTQTLMPPDRDGSRAQINSIFNESTLPMSVTTSKSITSAQCPSAGCFGETDTLDVFGRVVQRAITSDPQGTDYSVTEYDAFGRKSQIFNPTRCNPPNTNCGETTWGYITNTFDALGRPLVQTSQDGGVIRNSYNGNIVTVTDQTGRQRSSMTDGFGRLVEVDEPGDPSTFVANNYGNLAQDGNFAVFGPAGDIKWETATHGATNTFYALNMQDDGNLVKYTPTWNTATPTTTGTVVYGTQACVGYRLFSGQTLASGSCLQSLNKRFMLVMQTAGNLVLYDLSYNPAHAIFYNSTTGTPGSYLAMQGDGNLVIYTASGSPVWSTGSVTGTGNYMLQVQDPGNLVIYRDIWETGTSQASTNNTTFSSYSCSNLGNSIALNQNIPMGSCLVSSNGRFRLIMQTDGNLVLYDGLGSTPSPLWYTSTTVHATPLSPGVALQTLYSYDLLDNLVCVEQHGNVAGTGCSAAPSSDATSPWRVRRFTYNSLSQLISAKNPESGTTSYTYDSDGNVLMRTSPAANQTGSTTQTISYCYDELHRPIKRDYLSHTYTPPACPITAPVVSYTYDVGANSIGKLTSVTDQAGSATFGYDVRERLANETRVIAGIGKSISFTYNLNNSPKTVTYPSGRVVTYTSNSAGHLTSAADNRGLQYVTSATYYPNGNEYQRSMPNVYFRTDLNNRLQVSGFYSDNGQVPTYFMSKSYVYNSGSGNNGNVLSIVNNKDTTRTQSFIYDQLNRITAGWSAANSGNLSWGENYTFDQWGNLQINPMSGKANGGYAPNASDYTNRYLGLNYDAAGNRIDSQYVYDAENRLQSAGGLSYTYDGDGARVLKSITSTGAPSKRYWLGGGNILAESDGAGSLTAEYVYFGGKRVARIDLPTSTVHYYLSDHLNSTSMIVSAGGIREEESDYSPYGTEYVVTGSGLNRYKFTGKERDSESGLDDFGARYYSAGLGRFVQADPLYVEKHRLIDPQQLNLYTYGRNNPLKYTDPLGLDITCLANRCDDYLKGLQKDVSFKIAYDKNKKVVTEGDIDKKSLSKTDKAILKAIDDTKHHVTINAIDGGKDSSVFLGASHGASHTIAFDQAALLDTPKNAGGMTSAQLIGHETLEGYAEAQGANLPDAHDFANNFFPGFDQPYGATPGARTETDLLSIHQLFPIHGTGVTESIEFKFDTPIPIKSINNGTARPTAGVPVDIQKQP
jgi:RHS repeat-associated protein